MRGADIPSAPIAWLPTLLAKGPVPLQREHLRRHPHTARAMRLHCIVLDTSGSMQRQGRLARAKGQVAALLEQAARQRDDVAVLCFGGQGVELLMPPGPARSSARQRLRPLGGGGGTPLARALSEADRLLQAASRTPASSRAALGKGSGAGRARAIEGWLWLLSDGRTLEQPRPPRAARHVVIVDFDDPLKPAGRCAAWAEAWGARYLRPEYGANAAQPVTPAHLLN
ncbi:vWA domain-containing protein [Hylemonella sp. W303a]|uniref:vWA domain-containing protein n=1 Tax=Hylemonella sp. W303a TaxID=3389873 RepID=UPI00396B023C